MRGDGVDGARARKKKGMLPTQMGLPKLGRARRRLRHGKCTLDGWNYGAAPYIALRTKDRRTGGRRGERVREGACQGRESKRRRRRGKKWALEGELERL